MKRLLTPEHRQVLIDKLIEWSKDEYHTEILIDTFLALLMCEGYDEDERLNLLECCADYFVDGHIRDRLIYEATAIKVNYGY